MWSLFNLSSVIRHRGVVSTAGCCSLSFDDDDDICFNSLKKSISHSSSYSYPNPGYGAGAGAEAVAGGAFNGPVFIRSLGRSVVRSRIMDIRMLFFYIHISYQLFHILLIFIVIKWSQKVYGVLVYGFSFIH